jgi:hypothetical protein
LGVPSHEQAATLPEDGQLVMEEAAAQRILEAACRQGLAGRAREGETSASH